MPLSESLVILPGLFAQCGLAEFGWGAAVGFAEGGAEMAVTGEAEVEAQSGEIVVLAEKIEGAGEAQAELVAIEGQSLDLLEDLREIDGGAADFGGNFSKRPAAGEVAGENELGAIDHFLVAECTACGAAGAWAEGAVCEGEGQAFSFERLCEVAMQAVAQDGHEDLSTWIDAQAMQTKSWNGGVGEQRRRGDFAEERFAESEGEAGVASGNGMADAIALADVEEEDLVGFGYGCVASEVADVGAAIGEDHLRDLGAFFGTGMGMAAAAVHIADGDAPGVQQGLNGDLRHGIVFGHCVVFRHR